MREFDIDALLSSARSLIGNAGRTAQVLGSRDGPDDWILEETISDGVGDAFSQLSVAAEAMNLPHLLAEIKAARRRCRRKKNGYLYYQHDPDGGVHLYAGDRIRRFIKALEVGYGRQPSYRVVRDVEGILRNCIGPITDIKLFSEVPQKESDVHDRIEAILKCVFPDLIRKPAMSKPMKNFIPDTGLPQIRTLLEYKYTTTLEQEKTISDDVLADTAGYRSVDWDNIILVVYQTSRLHTEAQWNNHLAECTASARISAVVLPGVPVS